MTDGTDRDDRRATPGPRRDVLERLGNDGQGVLLAAVVFVAGVGVWQTVTTVTGVPSVVLPSPVAVVVALYELRSVLLTDAAVTGATAALGLVAGVVVGTALAFLMVASRPAASIILPYVVALRIAPLIAIAPLLFLWFGRGIPGKALLVTTLTVFPMTIAALDGLRSTPESYLALFRSVGASTTAVFLYVRLPAAAPSVFAGLKIAATLSVIGAVVAEFVTLDAGLGVRVFESSNALQTADSFAAVVALSLLGLLFYGVPSLLERAVRIRFR
jgi:ABC-type nitrate/sulfonate/bicarbonate transport system permease component